MIILGWSDTGLGFAPEKPIGDVAGDLTPYWQVAGDLLNQHVQQPPAAIRVSGQHPIWGLRHVIVAGAGHWCFTLQGRGGQFGSAGTCRFGFISDSVDPDVAWRTGRAQVAGVDGEPRAPGERQYADTVRAVKEDRAVIAIDAEPADAAAVIEHTLAGFTTKIAAKYAWYTCLVQPYRDSKQLVLGRPPAEFLSALPEVSRDYGQQLRLAALPPKPPLAVAAAAVGAPRASNGNSGRLGGRQPEGRSWDDSPPDPRHQPRHRTPSAAKINLVSRPGPKNQTIRDEMALAEQPMQWLRDQVVQAAAFTRKPETLAACMTVAAERDRDASVAGVLAALLNMGQSKDQLTALVTVVRRNGTRVELPPNPPEWLRNIVATPLTLPSAKGTAIVPASGANGTAPVAAPSSFLSSRGRRVVAILGMLGILVVAGLLILALVHSGSRTPGHLTGLTATKQSPTAHPATPSASPSSPPTGPVAVPGTPGVAKVSTPQFFGAGDITFTFAGNKQIMDAVPADAPDSIIILTFFNASPEGDHVTQVADAVKKKCGCRVDWSAGDNPLFAPGKVLELQIVPQPPANK